MNNTTSETFIKSLAKSIQSLCKGCVDYNAWVHVTGHLYLSVETGDTIEYVVNEKLLKLDKKKVTLQSSSFHAQRLEKKPVAVGPSDVHTDHYIVKTEAVDINDCIEKPPHQDVSVVDERGGENKTAKPLLYGSPSGMSLHPISQADKDGVDQLLSGTNSEKHGLKRGKYNKRLKKTKTKERKSKKDGSHSSGLMVSEVDDCSAEDCRFLVDEVNLLTEIKSEASPLEAKPKKKYKRKVSEHMCEECGASFPQNYRLQRHKKSHSGIKPHQCVTCGMRFTQKCNMQSHMIRHLGIKPYVCQLCDRAFGGKSDLNTHLKSHSLEKPWECDQCGKRFGKKYNLRVHQSRHTGEKKFICDICKCRFANHTSLTVHKRQHLPEKPFKCEFCSARFNTKIDKQIHHRKHTGEKPFQCEHCGKAFTSQTALRGHRAIHSAVRTHECGICQSRFTTRGNLQSHMRVHNQHKPHICDDCGKGFYTNSYLMAHKRTHTGEKPYACPLCPSSFSTSGVLRAHMIRHSKVKKYTCDVCDLKYGRRSSMIRHKMTHHGYRTPQDELDRNKGLGFKKTIDNIDIKNVVERCVVEGININENKKVVTGCEALSSAQGDTFHSRTDLEMANNYNAVNTFSTKQEYFEGVGSINHQKILNQNVAGIISADHQNMTLFTKHLNQNVHTHSSSSNNNGDVTAPGLEQRYVTSVAERWCQ